MTTSASTTHGLIAHNEGVQDRELNLEAKLTISQLELFFFGTVSRRTIDEWVRSKRIAERGRNSQGHILVRLGDALEAEASTWRSKRGRPRKVRA